MWYNATPRHMNARLAATELQYVTLLQQELEATRALLISACSSIPFRHATL